MRRISPSLLIFILAIAVFLGVSTASADFSIPGSEIIQPHSIATDGVEGGDAIAVGQAFGWKILSLMKIIISGFALIFIVMMGVYMVVFSDSEEEVKKQKKQILYTLVGFLFLNIPGIVYRVMSPENLAGNSVSVTSWTDVSVFWYTATLPGFIGNMVAFIRVFAYGSAVVMLTWGMFRLILSAGDEEQLKIARYRIIYSTIALIFMLFIDAWIRMVVNGNLTDSIPGVAGILIKLSLFFVAPAGIFFLIYGAYYFITSAGNEERMKKGKAILVNTFIASIILIAAFTFLTDIVNFRF